MPRGSRTRKKDSLKIGFYTPEEVQIIENYKIKFCTTHSVSGTKFDEMIQHSERGGNGDFPVPPDVITKVDFWNEIYALMPDRDRRSVYRFMRRHFQASTQKAHDWTPEQEEELISLHAQHGPKWTYIGRLIGRSDDDVTQRWKNKLEHKGVMNRGNWDADETKTFLDAMESSWVNMKPLLGATAGKDFYELDERLVSWGNVSKAMGHRRSRQQCADKWRKIIKQVKTMRANGFPDAVFDVEAAVKNSANWSGRQAKTSEYVVEEEDEEDEENAGDGDDHPRLSGFLSNIAQPVSQSSRKAEPGHETQSEAGAETEQPDLPNKSKKPKRKRPETPPDAHDETQAEVDAEPELPRSFKKSKRHHVQQPSSDAAEAVMAPATPKKSKAERKKEKKELREREERERIEAETEAKLKAGEKAARKEAKRLGKAEMRKRKEEEARLAAQESSPEPPQKRKAPKKAKQALSDEPEHHDHYSGSEDDGDVPMKYESGSGEL